MMAGSDNDFAKEPREIEKVSRAFLSWHLIAAAAPYGPYKMIIHPINEQ
jgi:hypothetical protein